jgi:hypothetical protein
MLCHNFFTWPNVLGYIFLKITLRKTIITDMNTSEYDVLVAESYQK